MKVTINIFGKPLKEMTKEEFKAYGRYMYNRNIKPFNEGYKQTISWKLFGKRRKDLSIEELRQYKNFINRKSKRYKFRAENSFAMKHFGKRFRDMSIDEKREYRRIRKAIHFKRKREGLPLPGRGYYIKGE